MIWKFSSLQVITRLLSLINLIFVAKLISIDQYATFILTTGTILAITELSVLGLNASLIKYVALYKGRLRLQSAVFYSSLLIIISMGILLWSISLLSATYLNLEHIFSNYRYLIFLGLLGALLHGGAVNFEIGRERQIFGAYLNIALPVTRFALILLIFICYGPSINLLILSFCSSPILVFVPWLILSGPKITCNSPNILILKRMLSFSINMSIWSLATVAYFRMDVFIINKLLTIEKVAIADLALKIVAGIMVFANAYGLFLKPKLQKLSINKQIDFLHKKMLPILIIGVASIVLVFLAFELLIYSLGPSYIELRQLAFWCSLSVLIYIICIPANNIIFVNTDATYFKYQACVTFFVGLGLSIFLIGEYSLTGFGLSFLLVAFLNAIASNFYAAKIADIL